MNYHNITTDDMLNGSGLRTVLWVAGCEHRCPKCQNPITWDPNDGLLFDQNAMNELKQELSQPYISGLSLSGGDPMFTGNRTTILKICKEIKSEYPHKNIWMYTGYKYEEIQDEPVMQYIDVLVDGKYVYQLDDPKKHWAGSSNQRIINISETIKQGKIITIQD
jgi:anaerobic ribonucleoside-triphosphate reductase activating protein